eukprot:9051594-Pyramimonas_sp.AAC.1
MPPAVGLAIPGGGRSWAVDANARATAKLEPGHTAKLMRMLDQLNGRRVAAGQRLTALGP